MRAKRARWLLLSRLALGDPCASPQTLIFVAPGKSGTSTLATLLDGFTHLLGASLRSSPRLAGLPTEIRRRRRQRVDLVLTVRR